MKKSATKTLTAANIKAAATDLKWDRYEIFGDSPFWASTTSIFKRLGFTPDLDEYAKVAKEAGFFVDREYSIQVP